MRPAADRLLIARGRHAQRADPAAFDKGQVFRPALAVTRDQDTAWPQQPPSQAADQRGTGPMSSRRDRREPPDELDRLVSAALHDMVRAAEPSPRVWHAVRAAVMAEQNQPAARRWPSSVIGGWRLSRWPGWTAVGRLLSWLTPVQTNPTIGFMTQAVQFADLDVSPRLVWWQDVNTRPYGPDWQTWMITT